MGEEGRAQPLLAGQIVVFNWGQYSDWRVSPPMLVPLPGVKSLRTGNCGEWEEDFDGIKENRPEGSA
jgi:hypothetical protein